MESAELGTLTSNESVNAAWKSRFEEVHVNTINMAQLFRLIYRMTTYLIPEKDLLTIRYDKDTHLARCSCHIGSSPPWWYSSSLLLSSVPDPLVPSRYWKAPCPGPNPKEASKEEGSLKEKYYQTKACLLFSPNLEKIQQYSLPFPAAHSFTVNST